jgi:ketosteroid isomerase-like protein
VTEHPNAGLTRQGYEAFAKGDLSALSQLIAADATWHVSDTGPLSGDYHGRDEIFGFFGRLAEQTGGTFRLEVHDVLANDEHAVVLCTLSASRANKSIEIPVANVSHLRGGKVTEFWSATADPQATTDFWK